MFEQQSYNFEVPAEPSQEGDLFHGYEIGNWNLSTRIYQILAVSAVFNLAILGFVTQAELLTTRGCDSPFVGRVCQVLDMAYVGTVLFGTNREYVDADYDRTDLADAEITYIDVSGVTPPFVYPEGFFYKEPAADLAAGLMADSGFFAPGIPANPTQYGSSVIDTPPFVPKSNPNAINGELPDSPFGNDNPTIGKVQKRPRGGRIRGVTDANDQASADDQPADEKLPEGKVPDFAAIEDINKRPFKNLAVSVNELLTNKELNLSSEFSVSATAKLNKEGRLEKKTFKFTKAESSDPKMIDVVKRSIEAFSESGLLQYLKDLSGKDLSLTINQDNTNISAQVQSELERETRADSLKGILKLGIDLAISKKEEAIAEMELANDPAKVKDLQSERDDLELLKNTKITTDGKKLVINFSVGKDVVQAMIQRKLAEQAAETKKDSSTTPVAVNNTNTAQK